MVPFWSTIQLRPSGRFFVPASSCDEDVPSSFFLQPKTRERRIVVAAVVWESAAAATAAADRRG
jgi:hypothetical protein